MPLEKPPEPALTAVEHGEALFDSPALSPAPFNPHACSTCHLADPLPTDDRIRTGVPLAGVVDRPSYWGGKEVDLLRSVNHCLKFFMLQDEPWTGQEPEARAIYAYLESLSNGSAPSEAAPFTVVQLPEVPPEGNRSRGEITYRRACEHCHGGLHTGDSRLVDYAPTLPDQVLADHPPDLYTDEERRLAFVLKIRHGAFLGYLGQMPPFSAEALSDEDIGDLLAVFFAP